jgi:hypothetical protein
MTIRVRFFGGEDEKINKTKKKKKKKTLFKSRPFFKIEFELFERMPRRL